MGVSKIQLNQILSQTEHRLFLGITLLICCLFFINLTEKTVAGYNTTIQNEQTEKRDLANTNERINLSGCFPCTTPIHETILPLQFLTLPFIFLSLLKRHLGTLILSFSLTSFTLFGYVSWINYTYYSRIAAENFHFMNMPFNNYLLLNSTVLDFILFLMLSVLCILQISILLRFVIEKFQAKILT